MVEHGSPKSGDKPEKELRKKSRQKVTQWAKALAIIGVSIFILNMALAWIVAHESNDYIMQPLISEKNRDSASAKAMDMVIGADANTHVFLNRLVEADVHHREVSNMQSAVIVTMAFAFGLTAVGFALFVMGIDKAFQFEGEADKIGRVVVRSTAPGVLCFALAAVIMLAAVTRSTPVRFTREATHPDPPIQYVGEARPSKILEEGKLPEGGRSRLDDILGEAEAKEETHE
jgi:hypothetical protein